MCIIIFLNGLKNGKIKQLALATVSLIIECRINCFGKKNFVLITFIFLNGENVSYYTSDPRKEKQSLQILVKTIIRQRGRQCTCFTTPGSVTAVVLSEIIV